MAGTTGTKGKVGRFTHRAVDALKAKEERYTVWEPGAHGQGNLGVRVSEHGTKTWVYQFRHGGKVRMQTLGRFPAMTVEEAHAAAAKAALDVSTGLDPATATVEQRRKDRKAATVGELVAQYLELYAKPRKRSADRDEALLKRNVLPAWKDRKAATVKRADVAELLDKVIARGAAIQANRTHSVLSRMFNWAVEREYVEHSPVVGLHAPVKEASRERCLSDEELRGVLCGLDRASMAPATRLALRFQVLTATRPTEATGARWDEITWDEDHEADAVWRLPKDRTKNGEAHTIPLSRQALDVLREAKALECGAGFVFPSPRHKKAGPVSSSALAHAVKDSLGVFGVAEFHPHDLRRTAATGMAALGADWTLLQKALNHKLRGETAKYVRHGYADELRDLFNRWGARVARIEAHPVLRVVRAAGTAGH
jgi:integrase